MKAGAVQMTPARTSPEVGPMLRHSTCSIPDCNSRVLARDWCVRHYARWQKHGDPLAGGPRRFVTDAERFWQKVERRGPDDCWLWRGSLTNGGYGHFSVANKPVMAHRWAYEQEIGPIPDSLTLDHLCRTRACVNARHLEPVTGKENILRGFSPSAQNARKTHCKRGHEFTPQNTYVGRGSERKCRVCIRIRAVRS